MAIQAVTASAALLWHMACANRDRAVAAKASVPNSQPTDAIVAIVLAAITAEAFINELPELVAMYRDATAAGHNMSPALRAFADVMQEIEVEHGSPRLKYLIASQTLSGVSFDKGANPFQDFAVLVNLRNEIVHTKPRETFRETPTGFIVQPTKSVKALQQRKLALNVGENKVSSGLFMMMTPETAAWACNTAKNIILAILQMIPDSPTDPDSDPSFGFKQTFRSGFPGRP